MGETDSKINQEKRRSLLHDSQHQLVATCTKAPETSAGAAKVASAGERIARAELRSAGEGAPQTKKFDN